MILRSAAIILTVIIFSSCEKKHTCVCTDTTTNTELYRNSMTTEKYYAKKHCEEQTDLSSDKSCKLE